MKDPFTDTLTAQPIQRRLLERDIQKECVAYARRRGVWARKLSSTASRSLPDYLFSVQLCGGKQFVWVEEFKAPDKGPSVAQIEEQDAMVAAGWCVHRDTGRRGRADIDAFKARIDALVR